MDLSAITSALDDFSTFGKAINSLFTTFAKFAQGIENWVNTSDQITSDTSAVFDGLSSNSTADSSAQ